VIRGFGTRALLAAALLAGCGQATQSSAIPISIENDTDVAVGLYVGGEWRGTYPSGASVEVPLAADVRLPTTIELLAPSGAVLISASLNEGQHGDSAAGRYGAGESVSTECGIVTLLVGRLGTGEALAPPNADDPVPCE
jgi:hypothetical protein